MHIQELNIHRNFFDTTNNKRIFFAIYYDEPDGERSFERAAETWRKKMLFQNNFKYGFDEFLMFRISHEIQFKNAWQSIFERAKLIKAEVFCGGIFSHASKSDNSDGLEFASRNLNDVSGDLNDVSGDLNDVSGDSNDATLKKTEIFNLPILPWNRKNGFLILCGCNTGLLGKRGWCPAKAFSIRQKIIVLGQKGYAYFSKNWNKYEMIDINNREVYLWAYKRRRNDFMGGIQEPAIRIEAAIFKGNML